MDINKVVVDAIVNSFEQPQDFYNVEFYYNVNQTRNQFYGDGYGTYIKSCDLNEMINKLLKENIAEASKLATECASFITGVGTVNVITIKKRLFRAVTSVYISYKTKLHKDGVKEYV